MKDENETKNQSLQTSGNQLSMSSNVSALVSYFPSEQDWKAILAIGKDAHESGMLPTAIKNPKAAAIIALKARELNIPYMVGFSHIHIINGKPSMSAELLVGLARKNLPGFVINLLKSTNEICEIEFIRPEKGSRPYIQSFSIEDAKRANLLNKDVWKQYPAAMLYSRCVTAGLRKICPEALLGISYTPEELGATVDAEGHVIETTGKTIIEEDPKKPQPEIIYPPQWKLSKQDAEALIAAGQNKDMNKQEVNDYVVAKYGLKNIRDINETQFNEAMKFFCGTNPVEVSPEFERALEESEDPRNVK